MSAASWPRSISVVIPTLNEATELPETIRLAGVCPEIFEIIVVDGGSTDGTPRLAEQLGCRVFQSPPGRGAQMRLGAAQARVMSCCCCTRIRIFPRTPDAPS